MRKLISLLLLFLIGVSHASFWEMCQSMMEWNQSLNLSYEGNPLIEALVGLNKDILINITYNGTKCTSIFLDVENRTLKEVRFEEGNYSVFMKLDLLFVDELLQEFEKVRDKGGLSLVMGYLNLLSTFLKALMRGDVVVRPIWFVFDFWNLLLALTT